MRNINNKRRFALIAYQKTKGLFEILPVGLCKVKVLTMII